MRGECKSEDVARMVEDLAAAVRYRIKLFRANWLRWQQWNLAMCHHYLPPAVLLKVAITSPAEEHIEN